MSADQILHVVRHGKEPKRVRTHIQGLLRKGNYVYDDKGFDSTEEYLRHEANPSPNHARMLTVSELAEQH